MKHSDNSPEETPADEEDAMLQDDELKRLKRQRATARGKFTRRFNKFKSSFSEEKSLQILETQCSEVRDSFKELENVQGSYVEALLVYVDEDNYETEVNKQGSYLTQCEEMWLEIYELLLEAKENERKVTDKVGDFKVKVKPVDGPKFSGDIRQYSTFCKDYKRIMMPLVGSEAFHLRASLEGEAAKVVVGVEDDFSEMMKRLDLIYGDPAKLTDSIMTEIKGLKPVPESDHEKFIAAVNKIESCWLDIKKAQLDREMSNTSVLSIIERILPVEQKKEWIKIYNGLQDKECAFEKLMEYLVSEKHILERMNMAVRRKVPSERGAIHVSNVEVSNASDDVMTILNSIKEKQQEQQSNIDSILSQMSTVMTLSHIPNNNRRFRNDASSYCWLHNTNTHDIVQCTTFTNMDAASKLETLRKHGVCFRCLHTGHFTRMCRDRRTCVERMSNGQVCGGPHHVKLHGIFAQSQSPEVSMHFSENNCERNGVLLTISQVEGRGQPITVLYDCGSNMSLITHAKARQLGLKGISKNITITKVGKSVEQLPTKQYAVPLTDEMGNVWIVYAYGMGEITTESNEVNMWDLRKIFRLDSNIPLFRPHGNVDMLIGADCCCLMPQVVKTVDNLQLMRNQFGFCVRGYHPGLRVKGTDSYTLQIHHVSAVITDLSDSRIEDAGSIKAKLDDYFLNDNLGIDCKPKCYNCKACQECLKEKPITIKDESEMNKILNGLVYNAKEKYWTINYPWIDNPDRLPNNFGVSVMRLKGTEKRLKKLGDEYTKAYCDQVHDMINRGVAKRLSKREIDEYTGPVHYISHHEVHKPGSTSTPARIVFNSSAPYNGHILNNYWAKGPDMLNNLFGILIRFRIGRTAFIGDISKMYNSVRLSEMDQHVHRFLWRDVHDHKPIDQYVLTAVPFGDRPSGAISMLAMRETARMMRDVIPEAANVIINSSYVDDICHSINDTYRAVPLMKEIESCLAEGGFKIKNWVMSGDSHECADIKVLSSDYERVLGLVWNPKKDEFKFETKINFSPQVKKVRTEPDLREEDVNTRVPKSLTKREVLSQISSIYDPLGLIAPALIRGKLLMRELIAYEGPGKTKLDWDDFMPSDLRDKWCKFFQEMFSFQNLTFPRSLNLVPKHCPYANPSLVIFSDGSLQAYGAVAYIRWKTTDNMYVSRLIAAKSRVTPIRTLTIPRLELCGALIAARLRATITSEAWITFSKVYHLTDSEIVKSQISKENLKVGTYVANRVCEIREKTSPEEWMWIPSEANVADCVTRPVDPSNLGPDSEWQLGPKFLASPVSKWPTKEVGNVNSTVEDVGNIHMSKCVPLNSPKLDVFNVHRFSCLDKLIRVTARVINVFRDRSFRGAQRIPEEGELRDAERKWVKFTQKSIPDDWTERFRRLGPFKQDYIIYVGSRISNWMKDNWNKEAFILLPHDHAFSRLCVQTFHEKDHAGVENTLCKLQSVYWMPKARKMIKEIKSKCVMCRRLEKNIVGQSMGPISVERLKPSPPFFHSALDLFGPFMVKDTVKRRIKRKVYGVVINCLITRAVYIDVVEGYDADSFITCLRRFTSIRGFPKTMYSDSGSQLVLANKELRDMVDGWDKSKICKFGVTEGMSWSFCKSADAPWENGCSEAMVKLIKRATIRSLGEIILTFSELQTTFFEIANLLNERPIGIKPGCEINLGQYLCPNDLLLGRSSIRTPTGSYSSTANLKVRQTFINLVTESFWKRWIRDYFPTLIVKQKWHVDKRNLCVGDVVLVRDRNALKNSWKLAQVSRIKPSSDGKVRDVELRYKSKGSATSYTGQVDTIIHRSVHSIILLLPVEEQILK